MPIKGLCRARMSIISLLLVVAWILSLHNPSTKTLATRETPMSRLDVVGLFHRQEAVSECSKCEFGLEDPILNRLRVTVGASGNRELLDVESPHRLTRAGPRCG